MKYYRLTDGRFDGFYDREIHGDLVHGGDFHQLETDKWQELLNGQSEGMEIRILRSGELGLYQVPALEEEMINPTFDYDKEIWIEQATNEEQLKHWEDKIISNQSEMNLRAQVGLYPTKEQLELKESLMVKHMNVCHAMALDINK